MSGNNKKQLFSATAFLTIFLAASVATAEKVIQKAGALSPPGIEEFHKTIDRKCTVCHARERVDIAIKNRKRQEEIQKRMLQRGAILSEQDKKVIGTFWGQPFKTRKTPGAPTEKLEPIPVHNPNP